MSDRTYMLPATCGSPRRLSARSAKSYQTYTIDVADGTHLVPGR